MDDFMVIMNRWQQVRHVTIPFMIPLFIIQLIFAIGLLTGSNTELIAAVKSSHIFYGRCDRNLCLPVTEGLLGGRFSYGTASSMLMSTISFILVFGANKVSDRLTKFLLW